MIEKSEEVLDFLKRLLIFLVLNCVIIFEEFIQSFLVFSKNEGKEHLEPFCLIFIFWDDEHIIGLNVKEIKVSQPSSERFPVSILEVLNNLRLSHQLLEFLQSLFLLTLTCNFSVVVLILRISGVLWLDHANISIPYNIIEVVIVKVLGVYFFVQFYCLDSLLVG